jgi:outer membrane protein OmpA-like peptidoglycan-associated protein
MKHFYLFFFAIIITGSAVAQQPSDYFREAEKAAQNGDWILAVAFCEEAFDMDSSSFELLVLYAESARETKDYRLAEKLYTKAYGRDEGKIFPDGLYRLAQMQYLNGRYAEAKANYKKFLSRHKGKASRTLVQRAETEIENVDWAMRQKQEKDSLMAMPLPAKLNGEDADIAPVLFDNHLFYSSYYNGDWNTYATEWPTGGTTKNVIGNAAGIRFDDNGSGAFFSRRGDEGRTMIMQGKIAENQSKVIPQSEPLPGIDQSDATYTMAHPATVASRKVLFFASNREGGVGGMDIWFSEWDGRQWGKPRNAGKNINTEGDELSPFYTNGQLFFSSDLRPGFGGQDVYVSRGIPGEFSKPVNMGQTVNSSANDFYFSYHRESRMCFVVSNKGKARGEVYTTCCNDIYGFRLPEKPKNTMLQDTTAGAGSTEKSIIAINQRLPVRLYFHNDEPNHRSADTTTQVNYMQAFQNYMELKPIYLSKNNEADAAEEVHRFFAQQVERGVKDLEMVAGLLLDELNKGNSLTLSVRGFASPRAKNDYNLNLTKRRTASLVNYFYETKNGVFQPYMTGVARNGAILNFELLPFGENKANSTVSDDLKDEKKSIYSVAASLERKIEIENIRYLSNAPVPEVVANEPQTPMDTVSFGKVKFTNEPLRYTLIIKNDEAREIAIDSVVAECGCSRAELSRYIIPAGGSSELQLNFAPFGPKGRPIEKYVELWSGGKVWRRVLLTVTGE